MLPRLGASLSKPVEADASRWSGSAAPTLIRIAGRLTAPLGYRGFWDLTAVICRHVPRTVSFDVRVGVSSLFRFQLSDPYWSQLICPGFAYEPEVRAVLNATRHLAPSFLDCGANYGFWSVVASDPAMGLSRVVAIEPAPGT